MPVDDWSYLVDLQYHKPGTLVKILKHNSPKYIKEQIKQLMKEGKIKNWFDIVYKAYEENKSIYEVLKELGVKYQERKFGKGSRRCLVCGSHDRIIRRYGLNICGRCFREMAQKLGFEILGE